jgi:hypothetical protein
MKRACLQAVVFVFALSFTVRADIDYTVNLTFPATPSAPPGTNFGPGSLTGTITTDGTIGTLATADIVNWNLTATEAYSEFSPPPVFTSTFSTNLNGPLLNVGPPGPFVSACFVRDCGVFGNGTNSSEQVVGSDLTATPTQLFFNFSGSDFGLLVFESGFNLFCVSNLYGACDGPAGASVEESGLEPSTEPLTGNVVIGTASATTVTPEPTFMALTGFGVAGLAFVAYRRRRTV